MNKWKYVAGGSVLAAAVMAVPMPAHAANTILYNLVPTAVTGGGVVTNTNNVTVSGVGSTITYTVYANIEDDLGQPTNCYYELYDGSITSTTSAPGGLQGTYATTGASSGSPAVNGVFTYNSALIVAGQSTPGYEDDGNNDSTSPPSANALVNSVGSTVPTNSSPGPITGTPSGGQWLILSTGSNLFQNGGGTDVTIGGIQYSQINLGTFTWVASQSAPGTTATVAMGGRPFTGLGSAHQVFKYVSDGVTESLDFGNANLNFGSSLVSLVPEPASIGIVGMAMAALGLRARRKTQKA